MTFNFNLNRFDEIYKIYIVISNLECLDKYASRCLAISSNGTLNLSDNTTFAGP